MKPAPQNRKAKPSRDQDRTTRKSDRKKIFVHGLHPFTKEEEIVEIFSQYCKVKDLSMKRADKLGRNRGYAFFTAPNSKVARRIIQSEHILHGRKIHCDLKHETPEEELRNHRKRVFLGGISKKISDQELIDFFSQFRKVRTAYGIVNIKGDRKNFGYVDYFNEEAALNAINSSPVFINGRRVEVHPFKKPKTRGRGHQNSKKLKKSKQTPSKKNQNLEKNSSKKSENRFKKNQDNQVIIRDGLSLSAPERPKQEELTEVANLALPNMAEGVLSCFMNKKGEQLIDLSTAYITASMNDDLYLANQLFYAIEDLKRELFFGDYMHGLVGFEGQDNPVQIIHSQKR